MSTFAALSSAIRIRGGDRMLSPSNNHQNYKSSRLRQEFPDRGQQIPWTERFRDISIGAGRHGLVGISAERIGRDDDDWNMGHLFLDAAGGFVAIHHRHLYIHEDEVRPVHLRRLHALFPCHGFDHFEAYTVQQVAHDSSVIFLIFHHEDFLAHAPSLLIAGCRTGRMNRKVAPSPSTDSTQIRPPCISMIFLEIASPRPVPPLRRVLELSTCWNSPKMRS